MRKRALFLLTAINLLFTSCNPELTDDEIPYVAFEEIVININLPEYQDLKVNGGHMYIDGGVRGLIVYRESPTVYHAFERNCSFQPAEACATVDVDVSNLYMIDPCCNSTFTFGGVPIGGPAWRPLREYKATLSSDILTITDMIVE